MKYGKKIYLSMFWVVLGIILVGFSFVGYIDQYWNGFGCGILAVGAIQIIRQLRYHKDEEYREKVDVELNDERNKYISMKAWSWAGYLFVMIMAVGTVVSRILEWDEIITQTTSLSVCLIMVLYWISYMVLKKKY